MVLYKLCAQRGHSAQNAPLGRHGEGEDTGGQGYQYLGDLDRVFIAVQAQTMQVVDCQADLDFEIVCTLGSCRPFVPKEASCGCLVTHSFMK